MRTLRLPRTSIRGKPVPRGGELRRITRLLGRFVSGERRLFGLALVMLIAETVTAIAEAFPLAYLIDFLTGEKVDLRALVQQQFGLTLPLLHSPLFDTVAVLAIAIVLMAMINSLADSLAEIYLARGGRLMGYNLRVALYAHLQRLSLAFYSGQRAGDLLTRVTGDVAALEDFITSSLSDMVGGLLLLAGTFGVLLWYSWEMALAAVLAVPVLAVVSNYFSQRIKVAAKKQRSRDGDLAASAQEMLTSIRVIQTYGHSGGQQQRFARQSQLSMESALETAFLQARFSWSVKVLESLILAAVVSVGAVLIDGDVITVGLLVFLTQQMDKMFKPTRKIIKEWNTVGKIYASVERIGDILDRQPAVQDAPDAVDAPPFRGEVEYRHVSFAYQPEPVDTAKPGPAQAPARLALHDLSFRANPGEVVALAGPSGAGKSTIVQLLPRLYDPHAGQVLIDGHDIRGFTLSSVRGQMSMVLQETVLFAGSVADNIAYGRADATREEIVAAAMQANAHDFIEQLPDGYDTLLGERAGNLSGGQRQRIAIARAFIRNAPILILDEPTTGLDAESTELVLLALQTLMKGKTTIIVSHDLNLMRHADKILVIKDGRIAESGTHRELLSSNGLYANLYNRQFGSSAAEDDMPASQPAAPPVDEPDLLDADENPPITARAFETMLLHALPQPSSSQVFQTLITQAVPALPTPDAANNGAPEDASTTPHPAEPRPREAPAARLNDRSASTTQPSIFETSLMHIIPDLTRAPGTDHQVVGTAGPRRDGPAIQPRLEATQLDLLQSPALQHELPTLAMAFDAEAMRARLQSALFAQREGTSAPSYVIEHCSPGQAIYRAGECCVLRYRLRIREHAGGRTFESIVGARVFPSSSNAATYMRTRLAPLILLMRGRAEIAPFSRPVALLEKLNMVAYAFPIDGELPTLVAATDPTRMLELFREVLPAASEDGFVGEECAVEVAQYRRQYRCVLRYRLTGTRAGAGRPEERVVYGKVAAAGDHADPGPVITALRAHLLEHPDVPQFDLPHPLGYWPDLRLSLATAVPGAPCVPELLKARLQRGPAPAGAAGLEETLDACAQILSTLHSAPINLGHRRTLGDELAALRASTPALRRISPALGARFLSWLDYIDAYADQSDPLRRCFCHGDFTYTQLLFDGMRSGLVDFDTVCQAEPALDLGQFQAYLRFAIQKLGTPAGVAPRQLADQLCDRFRATYIAVSPTRLEDEQWLNVRVSIYEIVSLLRMALHSWQQLKVARLEHVLVVLEEQLACLPQPNT